jgi:DNA-binding transcriptional ArsR family regulator
VLSRLRILRALRDGDAGAIDLSRRLDVRRTTVLHHIAQLRSAGLVQVTLEGSAGRYRLREDALHDLADLLAKYLLA